MPNYSFQKISVERELQISHLAEFISDNYSIDNSLDFMRILEKNTITHNYGKYSNAFEGLLECKNGQFHIFLNLDKCDYEDSPRARFTLGHELGHYFIDEHRNALKHGKAPSHPSFCEYNSPLIIEYEADLFSSNLLMPKKRFEKIAYQEEKGICGIFKLQKIFNTSFKTTIIRYVQLSIIPIVVMFWRGSNREWIFFSKDKFWSSYYCSIKDKADLPKDCATKLAINGIKPNSGNFFDYSACAVDWFENITINSKKDMKLIEQVISLGGFGIITVLIPEEFI